MSLYAHLKQMEAQLDDLLAAMAPLCGEEEALRRARAAFKEGMEDLVYAGRRVIAAEGVVYECTVCGREFAIHHGAHGCPAGHMAEAEVTQGPART